MKSLGVEGRSIGVGVEVTLETYHDKDGIDQGECNDEK